MPALFKTGAIQSDVENEKNREAKKAEGLERNCPQGRGRDAARFA